MNYTKPHVKHLSVAIGIGCRDGNSIINKYSPDDI
jgi:hypothetical protein